MRRFTDFFILMGVLAAMIGLFGVLRESFFSLGTLGTVANRIPALALVATVMSNLGLERFLEGRGLRLERTAVGDRYVVERMREDSSLEAFTKGRS